MYFTPYGLEKFHLQNVSWCALYTCTPRTYALFQGRKGHTHSISADGEDVEEEGAVEEGADLKQGAS